MSSTGIKTGQRAERHATSHKKWIAVQAAAGWYANASGYIRELIRWDQQAKQSLRFALIDGECSGVSERTVSDVVREARPRLRAVEAGSQHGIPQTAN
jgi:antitoxin ParD1/3/4